jgi:hypothetical protein
MRWFSPSVRRIDLSKASLNPVYQNGRAARRAGALLQDEPDKNGSIQRREHSTG